MWEQFITDMQGRALQLDALRSSHPIQVPIANAEEVEQVFDAISYCKGGSVVRMVHAVVGKDHFVQGLRAYMREFKYGNATTGDLWKACPHPNPNPNPNPHPNLRPDPDPNSNPNPNPDPDPSP